MDFFIQLQQFVFQGTDLIFELCFLNMLLLFTLIGNLEADIFDFLDLLFVRFHQGDVFLITEVLT